MADCEDYGPSRTSQLLLACALRASLTSLEPQYNDRPVLVGIGLPGRNLRNEIGSTERVPSSMRVLDPSSISWALEPARTRSITAYIGHLYIALQ